MPRKCTYLQTLPVRLLLYIALPILVAMGVVGTLVIGTLENHFERRMQEDVEMVARALQRPVSHALERQRHGSLRSSLESALDIGRVYGAYLYNEGGTLLASLGTVRERRHPHAASQLRYKPRGGGHYGFIQGEAVYSYYVPVRLGGDRGTGLLRITRRKADIDEFMSHLRSGGAVLMLAAAIAISLVVAFGYHRAAGAAFQNLHRSMARIVSGDRSHRAQLRGPHEVRSVVRRFNSMLDSIQEAEERLERGRQIHLQLQAKLSASEKLASIGRLAAGIAHELGTPLGTVAGRVQRLMRRTDLSSPMTREIKGIAAEVRRMERLVQEVLDFGRREGLRYSRVSANEVVSTIHALFLTRREAPNVGRFEVLEQKTDVMLQIDASRVEGALVNLVRNAFQAASNGHVRLSWHALDSGVCLVVEDDGPGVPLEHRHRIFEPFFTTRSNDGTGLGLSIVATVAHEHRGEIRVRESTLGGARFELLLPLVPSSATVSTTASDDKGVDLYGSLAN